MSDAIELAVREAHDGLCFNGGATVSINGRPTPEYGFMVGNGDSEYVTKTVTYDTIRQFIAANDDLLRNGNAYLGLWQTDTEVYIDVSNWVATLAEALFFARERGELAIFDLFTGETVTV